MAGDVSAFVRGMSMTNIVSRWRRFPFLQVHGLGMRQIYLWEGGEEVLKVAAVAFPAELLSGWGVGVGVWYRGTLAPSYAAWDSLCVSRRRAYLGV